MRLIIVLLLALPALAQAQTISPGDPNSVVAALQQLGYQAQLDQDSNGDPLIRSSTQGSTYRIFFYGCSENTACESMNFSAGFNMPDGWNLSAVNEWNKTKLLGRVYLDDEGDPFIDHYVEAKGGLPFETFKEIVRLWGTSIAGLKTAIDW